MDNSILGLATIRHNRGISLEQISETTKISMRSLRAIEVGDFKKLPGGIYNTSYIRQYARAIDFDETVILKYYDECTGASPSSATTQSDRKNDGTGFGGYRPKPSVVRS
ncbi:MAG: helix-turn-helix domain-containing protein [Acidobacteria bacterium]|nr:helix-turn-helix domain-containing protein [Acidobacteriota bacterium]